MEYVTTEMALGALQKMKAFNDDMKEVFSHHHLSFSHNLGRRNGVLSYAQEKFFADELSKKFQDVISDGKTGQPDIIIGEIDKELECKITSGNGKYFQFSLQTDYNALLRKKCLDHLYVLANRDFDKFAVLFFENLTSEDFYFPSPGAKGKSRMRKEKALQKCKVLWGNVSLRNKAEIEKIKRNVEETLIEKSERLQGVSQRIEECSKKARAKMQNLQKVYKNEKERYDKKLEKLGDRERYWRELSPTFSFNLKALSDEKANQ